MVFEKNQNAPRPSELLVVGNVEIYSLVVGGMATTVVTN